MCAVYFMKYSLISIVQRGNMERKDAFGDIGMPVFYNDSLEVVLEYNPSGSYSI